MSVSFFYQHLSAQYDAGEFWRRMTRAEDKWIPSILTWMLRELSTIYVSGDQASLRTANELAHQMGCESKCLQIAPEHTAEHHSMGEITRDDELLDLSPRSKSTISGLIALGSPEEILLLLVKNITRFRPATVIFRLQPPGQEKDKPNIFNLWISLFTQLENLGYSIHDPCGDNLSIGDNYRYSSACVALAICNPITVAEFKETTASYHDAFEIDNSITVISPRFHCNSAEIVSLRTASMATGSYYKAKESKNAVFDIYHRKYVSDQNTIELAYFDEAWVLPRTGWKVFAGNRYYIEEIGPSAWEGLFNISHWRSLDGRWGIDQASPVIEHKHIPANCFLLGGDAAYYHWIFNFLPRLASMDLLEKNTDNLEPLPVLIPDNLPGRLLEIVPKLAQRPIEIIKLQDRSVYSIKGLYVPSFYSSHEGCLDVAEFYRDRLRLAPQSTEKRIYISRSDARDAGVPRRKVKNEAEVIRFLSDFGFEAVILGSLSAEEQINLFSEANFVIGPHGAAFANMVFSQPGTKAIIFENSWNHTFMKDVLFANGMTAETLLCRDEIDEPYEQAAIARGESSNELRRSRDMVVDLCNLKSMLVDKLNT